jgi:ketosteroid isomerase-like protein
MLLIGGPKSHSSNQRVLDMLSGKISKRIFSTSLALMCASSYISLYAQDISPLLRRDSALAKAISNADRKAVSSFLGDEFTWTDIDGKLRTKDQTLKSLGAIPSYGMGSREAKEITYGDLAIVTFVKGNLHGVRIWAKQGSEWRVLAYQDTQLFEKAIPGEPHPRECENPCKTLPFTPKNDAEAGIIASWQTLETAVTNHESQTWAAHVSDDFVLINSNNDRVMTKADRMAILDKQKISGASSAPVPLVSASMYDFGDAVLMKALHKMGAEKPVRVTRVWIKRDGVWLMAFSQQNVVQNEPL